MPVIPPSPTQTRKGLLGEIPYDPFADNAESKPPAAQSEERKDELSLPEDLLPNAQELNAVEHQHDSLVYPPSPSAFSLSFEFFPPHTVPGLEKLKVTTRLLGSFYPAYYSITFGAAGGSREYTINTALTLKQATAIPIAPHISCIGGTKESIRRLLNTYKQAGIRRLVVLRGDIPSGMVSPGLFRYAANLIEFIRQEMNDHFFLEVAAYPECHPESINPDSDFKYFHAKVNAGVDRAITQYFYNADSYWYFVERCQRSGVTIPIVPGIMPITNFRQLKRFSDSCGAEIPRWIRLRLAHYQDDMESLHQFGTEVVTRMCQQLLDGGAPGLHFYTINKAEPTTNICQQLRWK